MSPRHTLRYGVHRLLREVGHGRPVRCDYTLDVDTVRLRRGAARVVTRRAGIYLLRR